MISPSTFFPFPILSRDLYKCFMSIRVYSDSASDRQCCTASRGGHVFLPPFSDKRSAMKHLFLQTKPLLRIPQLSSWDCEQTAWADSSTLAKKNKKWLQGSAKCLSQPVLPKYTACQSSNKSLVLSPSPQLGLQNLQESNGLTNDWNTLLFHLFRSPGMSWTWPGLLWNPGRRSWQLVDSLHLPQYASPAELILQSCWQHLLKFIVSSVVVMISCHDVMYYIYIHVKFHACQILLSQWVAIVKSPSLDTSIMIIMAPKISSSTLTCKSTMIYLLTLDHKPNENIQKHSKPDIFVKRFLRCPEVQRVDAHVLSVHHSPDQRRSAYSSAAVGFIVNLGFTKTKTKTGERMNMASPWCVSVLFDTKVITPQRYKASHPQKGANSWHIIQRTCAGGINL